MLHGTLLFALQSINIASQLTILMLKRPKVGVGVIIRKGNQYLMMRRKNAHGEGTWCFPGGHLELNEEIEECARREVIEETGLKITNVRFAAITNDIFTDEGKHYITIFMQSDYESGEPTIMEPEKCTQIGWFSWDNLPSPLFLPNKNLIRQGFTPY
jgi:8-oxo-dGTP diphosphatase